MIECLMAFQFEEWRAWWLQDGVSCPDCCPCRGRTGSCRSGRSCTSPPSSPGPAGIYKNVLSIFNKKLAGRRLLVVLKGPSGQVRWAREWYNWTGLATGFWFLNFDLFAARKKGRGCQVRNMYLMFTRVRQVKDCRWYYSTFGALM